MASIALCADSESLCRPGLIGLEGEVLEGLSWLALYSAASEARCALEQAAGVEEAWVLSCDEMDAINLAAAIKRDRPGMRVFLVTAQQSGSGLSRAQAAGLDGVLSPRAFALRYAQEKKKHSLEREASLAAPSIRREGLPSLAADDVCEEDFEAQAVPLRKASDQKPAHTAFALCVFGAGGGVGSSSFALFASHVLARRGLSVLLIDADLHFGILGSVSEAADVLPLSEAADKPSALKDLPQAGKVSCIAAPERMELAERLGESLPGLVDEASNYFDAIVIDAGGPFSDMHMTLVEHCSHALLLVGQRSSSIRACKRIVDVFERCGAATGSLVFAVNRCSKGSIFSSVDVSCLLRAARVLELRDGGRIVEELVGLGAASSLVAEGNAFATSVERLLESLLPEGALKGKAGSKPSPKRLFGEGFRVRRPIVGQKRGEGREHDAA